MSLASGNAYTKGRITKSLGSVTFDCICKIIKPKFKQQAHHPPKKKFLRPKMLGLAPRILKGGGISIFHCLVESGINTTA